MRNCFMICFMFTVIFFSYSSAIQCHAAVLQGLDVVSTDESTDVILRIDEKIRYQQKYLPASDYAPARCYIDLYSTSRNQYFLPEVPVNSPHISKIRYVIYPTKLRVALDLPKNQVCSVVSLVEDAFQLRISVTNPHLLKAVQEGLPGTGLTESAPIVERPAIAEAKSQISPTHPIDTTTETGESAVEDETQSSAFTAAGGDDMPFWGWAQFFSAYDTQKDRAEDHNLSRFKGRLGADWEKELNPDHLLELHAAIELDRIFYDSDLADDDTEIKLHETYLQSNHSAWDMSFGIQRVRWGKSDQLSPIDSINPQDFRQFMTIDLEERALPSWMVRNRWHGESIGLETIIQPWFQKSELEYFDSDWALYRNLRQAVIDNPLSTPGLKSYVRNLHVHEDEPSNTLENMSAAARFTWKTEQTDFALSYHYGWETLPTITSFPVKNINYSGDPDEDPTQLLTDAIFTNERVKAEYKRQQIVGFEWETVLDLIGFRGEIAYIDHVAFLTSDLTSERKPVSHLVSGIDYTSATEWYFNLQGSWYHIYDYAGEILYFEEDTVSVLGEISKPFWRGDLELSAKYNYTITDQSSYLQPSATLKCYRNLECEVGAMIFSGDGGTLLGSYDQADQIYGRIKYSF